VKINTVYFTHPNTIAWFNSRCF